MLRIQNILVTADTGAAGDSAYTHALELARRFGSRIHVLHVIRPRHPGVGDDWVDPHPHGGTVNVRALPSPDGEPEVGVVHAEVVGTSVAREMVAYARKAEIDLIVTDARRMWGPVRRRFNSPALGAAGCSILTVSDPLPGHGLRRLLVPVDMSAASRSNLTVARELADSFDSEIDLLLVLDEAFLPTSFALAPSIGLEAERLRQWAVRLGEFWEDADGPAVPYRVHVRTGAAGPEIVRFALRTTPDLIVIGTHGRSGLRRLVLGSVAEHVVHHVRSSTLAVKTFGRPLLPLKRPVMSDMQIPAHRGSRTAPASSPSP